jgi:hypothetical protein
MVIQMLSYIPNNVNEDMIKVMSSFVDVVQDFMSEALICVCVL